MGFEQLVSVGFGWLLGLLSPAIVEHIRKNYRRSDLTRAIETELHGLQYKMAWCSYQLNSHLCSVSDEFLVWLEQIVRSYSGPHPVENVLTLIEELKKDSEHERSRKLARTRKPNVGLGLLQYSLPFINAHFVDISLYPIPFQFAVIDIKDQLDIYNQRVAIQQNERDRTFDSSLGAENRDAVLSGIEAGNADLAQRSRSIAEAISRVPYVSSLSSRVAGWRK